MSAYTLLRVLGCLSLVAGLALPGLVLHAQEGAPPDGAELQQQWEALPEEDRARVREEMRQQREALDSEQRDALREEAQQRWRELTPEQRQRAQEQRQTRRDRWEQLSPEEREAWRGRMRGRRDEVAAQERQPRDERRGQRPPLAGESAPGQVLGPGSGYRQYAGQELDPERPQ